MRRAKSLPGATLSGTASFFIARNAGTKPTRNSKTRAGPKGKKIAPLQFYLRRLEPLALQFTDTPLRPVTRLAALRKTEYPGRDPGSDRAAAPDARSRAALGRTHRALDRAGARPTAGKIARAITDDASDGAAMSRAADFYHGGTSARFAPTPREPRDLLCVVEQATDILPLEKTSAFRGRYHSLGGRISPLDHVGPEDLRIKELLERVENEKFSEIIFALAADVEGEATTNYLVELLKDKPVTLTRIAHGLPAGGGLESADELTLYQALSGRTKL